MKKILSINYSAGAFNVALLLQRLVFGILMMANHGYDKLIHFRQTAADMPSLLGIGSTATASLVIFAEFFCALFVAIGLFTRLASVPVIICMSYALFKAHNGQIFEKGEMSALYLTAYSLIILIGPGKISVDGMIGK